VTRFLADENVSRLVVERLRAAGFDVASARETTPGAPDKDIAAWVNLQLGPKTLLDALGHAQ
jgi:hypothetical protein